jgi:signal transduction histidine kinase
VSAAPGADPGAAPGLRAAAALAAADDRDGVLRGALDAALEVPGVCWAAVALRAADGASLLPAASRGAPPFRVARLLAFPLDFGDAVAGALVAGVPPGAGLPPADRAHLLAVAGLTAQALDRVRRLDAARDAVRLRDQVLAAVAHDLKNPLTVIRAQAQVLARRYAGGLPPADAARLTAGLDRIRGETRRMTRWIDELADVARLHLGQPLPLERQTLDLVALATRVAAEEQGATDAHRILVTAAPAVITGIWDAARLERVLVNLIGNAVKYSPLGGDVAVDLSVDPATPAAGAFAVVRVTDAGIGIPAGALERIFEPYFRAGNAAAGTPGSGLGLFSVRQIVERHGGAVGVVSREGAGAAFTVRLPL